jgi:hypothetical protein
MVRRELSKPCSDGHSGSPLAIAFLFPFALTFWFTQPPFRLHRKLIAKLPYACYLLVTDLDSDGHPELLACHSGKPPIWIRSPFEFSFAADIDGDGREEVIGRDEREQVRLTGLTGRNGGCDGAAGCWTGVV